MLCMKKYFHIKILSAYHLSETAFFKISLFFFFFFFFFPGRDQYYRRYLKPAKENFSETPQGKYDHVIFLQPKSPKKCCKNFENRFTNKIIIILNRPFACAREVI